MTAEEEPYLQVVFDRATPTQQERYFELMRHDPVAGMAYLEAVAIKQRQTRKS